MCWPLVLYEMYEGKNIHYSLVDNKPLCSFSQKQCNQRRLNGYGFCVRHILEDPTAPFRRCAYVAKSSQHLCTQAIPQGEDRPYCNNHMQVLGMLPRRERKPKKEKEKDKDKDKDKDLSNRDKDTMILDSNKVPFGDRLKSKKLTLPKAAHSPLAGGKILNAVDDPDDPYAFHDAAPEVSPVVTSVAPTVSGSVLPGGISDVVSRSPYSQSLPSPSQSRPAGEAAVLGGMPKAKLYPELAEKLEKSRPSQDAKTSKARARSSRTMNKLQTKIAQNKIKDKLRKSQESNQAELSPSQVASPERMTLTSNFINAGIIGGEFGGPLPGTDVTSINLNTPLHPLPLQGLGIPHIDSLRARGLGPGLSGPTDLLDIEHLSQAIVPPQQAFHSLPPPYPGLPVHRENPFSPSRMTDGNHTAGLGPVVETPVTTSLSSLTHLNPYLSFSQASSLSLPVVSPAQSQPHHLHLQHQPPSAHQSHLLSRLQPPTSDPLSPPVDKVNLPFSSPVSSVLNQNVNSRTSQLNSANSLFSQTSAILTSKPAPPNPLLSPRAVDVQPSLDLPPPPPYVPRTGTSSVPTSVTHSSSVLLTHIQRPKGVWTEKEAHCRLKNEDAVKLYGMYVRQKIYNHIFINSTMSLCASDEESSEDEMTDEPLPYQRDWKTISDDEEDNELEEDGELPSDLRMVKLGVMRARYRRHCTQTKHATRINTKNMVSSKKFALALIRLAKNSPTTAAHTLSAVYKKPLQWPQERKVRRKPIWRKVCQYKDGADKRCTVVCLPYANHCRKHVMYNVDQQMFQFCTAKNSDNTQCCMPVIDIRHDFPLCYPHALQAEQQKKEEAAEVKKRPRKKTKPPALTRPPRKGKKKKGKNMRYQKPIPPDVPTTASTDIQEATPMEVTPSLPESQPEITPDAAPLAANPTPVSVPAPVAPVAIPVTTTPAPTPAVGREVKGVVPSVSSGGRVSITAADPKQQLEHALDLEETDFDKQLAELPLEQASRLLEDEAFENFPDDAFNDIFSMADKNGENDLARENEKLERQLAEVTDNVNKAKDTLDKLLKGSINIDDMGEQDTKQLAEMIATHYSGISVDSVQQADITTSGAGGLDTFSGLTPDQAIGELALSLHTQPPQLSQPGLSQQTQLSQSGLSQSTQLSQAALAQPPQLSQTAQLSQSALSDFTAVSVAEVGRGLVPQTSVASYLPPGLVTTINGVSVPGGVAQSSVAYNQALVGALPAAYTPSPTLQQQLGVHAGGLVYSEGHLAHNYHVVQTASQTHTPLPSFSTLQGLPSAAVLLSGGDLSAAQQLIHRNLSRQQQSARTPSSLPHARHMDVGSGTLHSQGSETLRTQSGSSPSSGRTLSVHSVGSGGDGHVPGPPQGPSTSQLPSQLQSQPVLAGQLASSAHPTWVHAAALQQQSGLTAGYHTLNGFPTTAPLPYSSAPGSTVHSLSSTSAARQSKIKTHHNQLIDPSHAVHTPSVPTTAAFSSLTKPERHSGGGMSSPALSKQDLLSSSGMSNPILSKQDLLSSGGGISNTILTKQDLLSNSAISNAIFTKQDIHSSAGISNAILSKHDIHSSAGISNIALTKQDLHSSAGMSNAIRVNATPSPPMTALKQDPRIAALAQQHSRAVGRSGSPGLPNFGPVHSPSPSHSPQTVTQPLPPFSSTLSAYQGSSTGS